MSRPQSLPPSELLKIGTYQVKIDDDILTVKVANGDDLVDNVVRCDFYTQAVNSEKDQKFVVGFDTHISGAVPAYHVKGGIVVLCSRHTCLLAYVSQNKPSSILKKFVEDHRNICIIEADSSKNHYGGFSHDARVQASDFLTRVRKGTLVPYNCRDLGVVAREVGVDYDRSISDHAGKVGAASVGDYVRCWDALAFTEDEVMALVYDSYICCKIGLNLMKESKPNKYEDINRRDEEADNEILDSFCTQSDPSYSSDIYF